ncbi:hypothetical protein DFR56_11118 [Pseudogracilibacillus auburnensis]|uniref:Peptidase M50-like protein n=1 Tax=Pseudogracilibacillus auburnensis TaxID=1494959 RepID=A0A2V3VTL8_9BACI|nr:hypothetical protein DFR56_11118 [Pseudogracilibacillus auburnensis]
MMAFILAMILTFVLHELGHIICIMIFNVTEGRRIYDFRIKIGLKHIYVTHIKYKKPFKNLIVAISGSAFPLLIAIVITGMFTSQFTSLMFLLAILNLLFLHPMFPDGKNALSSMKEMER